MKFNTKINKKQLNVPQAPVKTRKQNTSIKELSIEPRILLDDFNEICNEELTRAPKKAPRDTSSSPEELGLVQRRLFGAFRMVTEREPVTPLSNDDSWFGIMMNDFIEDSNEFLSKITIQVPNAPKKVMMNRPLGEELGIKPTRLCFQFE